ncbi:hypothetical protein NIES4071_102230 (plasmid) [Calothrix sp. NIES-4071]|nr:hypothetical protein NIES4071_102230 [Calothrix sp. NIES-4071]BAZ64604.1 hypothetical protein NIES4105_103370 [Calothrix sp. NIES-4105]
MSKVKKEKQFFKIGKSFGDLIVINEPSEDETKVKCVCKKTFKVVDVDKEDLKVSNLAKKKGNTRKANVPEVGRKINLLTVISSEIKRDNNSEILIKVRCECGNEKYVRSRNLVSGSTTSCGCVQKARVKENRVIHGLYKSKEYKTWQRLKTICFNENNASYKQNKEAGIEMYPEWVNSFQLFYDQMGPAPKGSVIARIDPTKGFFPNNCCWVTREESKNMNNLLKCGINPKILIQPKAQKSIVKSKNTISKNVIAAIRKEHAKGESNISILSQKYGIIPNEILSILIYE